MGQFSQIDRYKKSRQVTGASAANYSISYTSGTLSVSPAPLLVIADDQVKISGEPLPLLSAHYSGLKLGDTSAVVSGLAITTDATVGSLAGNYVISPSGATAPNYTVSFLNGVLTVTSPAPAQDISALARLTQNPGGIGAASFGVNTATGDTAIVTGLGAGSNNVGVNASTGPNIGAAVTSPGAQFGVASTPISIATDVSANSFANGFLDGSGSLPAAPQPLTTEEQENLALLP